MLDPRHPLYGRTFRVHSVQLKGADGTKGRIVVHLEGDALLRLPAGALVPLDADVPASKLTIEAVLELLDRAQQFGALRRRRGNK